MIVRRALVPVMWVLSIAGTWLLVWYAVVLLGRAL